MHSWYSNVDTERIWILYWTIVLIKVNDLDTITPIHPVACNNFPCIKKVNFLYTWIKERLEDLCSTREVFDRYGSWQSFKILVMIILKKYSFFPKLVLRTFSILSNVLGCLGIFWNMNLYMRYNRPELINLEKNSSISVW